MVNLTIGKNDEDKTEYYLNGLETYESFEQVTSEMINLGATLIDQLDGIYSRTALFDLHGKKFKIIFHEDIGIYASSVAELNNEKWLHEVLINVVNKLNRL